MAKTIKVELRRNNYGENTCDLYFPNIDVITLDFCWEKFKKIARPLCKGLRRGQIRKLKLTHLKKGIKIELI